MVFSRGGLWNYVLYFQRCKCLGIKKEALGKQKELYTQILGLMWSIGGPYLPINGAG